MPIEEVWIEFLKPWKTNMQTERVGDKASYPAGGAAYLIEKGIAKRIEAPVKPDVVVKTDTPELSGPIAIVMTADYHGLKAGQRYNTTVKNAEVLIQAGVAQIADPNPNKPKNTSGNNGERKENSFAKFLRLIAGTRQKDREQLEDEFGSVLVERKAALGESSGGIGGYTVPPQFAENIMGLIGDLSIFRSKGAMIQPMDSATLQVPYLDITALPHRFRYRGLIIAS